MIKQLIALNLLAVAMVSGMMGANMYSKTTDSYIRDRVVQLYSDHGGCSAIQIKAPSGNVYTLTARHCSALLENNRVRAKDEQGHIHILYLIDIDKDSDLMLLTSGDNKSIDVAAKIKAHQHVRTMTHGSMFPSYRTDGELLEEKDQIFPVASIQSKEDEDKCLAIPSQSPMETMFGRLCVLTLRNMAMTARVVPGSSGGAVYDNYGHLVGIVSALDDMGFGYMIPLHNIQAFLKDR